MKHIKLFENFLFEGEFTPEFKELFNNRIDLSEVTSIRIP